MAPKKVLVVGAGAAGMSCAHHLSNHPDLFDVTVIESTSSCGGQAFSIPIDEAKHGASWLNQGVQGGSHIFRHTFSMFRSQGYDVHPVNLQISFGKGSTFWTNVFPTQLHENHANEIKKFRKVLKVIKWFSLGFVFIPIWVLLKMFRFSKEFGNYMIMPSLALFLGTGNATPEVNSVILERLYGSPTVGMWYDDETADKSKKKEGVLSGNNPDMVVFPNLSEFYETWRKSLVGRGVEVRLNTEVVRVLERGKEGVKVLVKKAGRDKVGGDQGTVEEYDELVFACLADTAKRLLGNQATWRERFILGKTKWSDDVTVTHWDSEYMEKHYTNHFDEEQVTIASKSGRDDSARIAQGKEFSPMYYINPYDQEPDKLEMAFNCSAYQYQFPKRPNSVNQSLSVPTTPFKHHVFQTIYLNKARDSHLWPKDSIDPSKVIQENWWHQLCHSWTHYIFVVPWLWMINNSKHTRYCGSWTLVNAHEVAVISGIAAAWSLGAEYPEEIEREGNGSRWEGFAVLCFRLYAMLGYGKLYKRRGGVKKFPIF